MGIIKLNDCTHSLEGGIILMSSKEMINEIKGLIPDCVGFIEVKVTESIAIVVGELTSSKDNLEDLIRPIVEKYHPNKMFVYSVKTNSGLTVVADDEMTTTNAERDLDKVKVLYYGEVPVSAITSDHTCKVIHDDQLQKLDDSFRVLGFLEPIVLNSNLEVVNGGLRLEVAKMNKLGKVLAVVLDDSGDRAGFLRLALNRLSEFQRWNHADVDDYVDSVPQAQPLLEPLGFFGRKLLPESFFTKSMESYEIDVFNAQQGKYRQESTVEEWAKLRRKEILEQQELLKKRKSNKPKQKMSLFDLAPKPEDFVETYDVKEEIAENVVEMKKLASEVTEVFDEIRKKEMEAKGVMWQNSRRNSREVAADNREEFVETINKSNLSASKKIEIINKLSEFDSKEELEAFMASEEEADE